MLPELIVRLVKLMSEPRVLVVVVPPMVTAPKSCLVELESVKVPVPSNVRACPPVALVKVAPLEIAKLPETFKVEVAWVKVPDDKVKAPLTSTAPEAPEVNVPPEIVIPPLKVWVPVEAE